MIAAVALTGAAVVAWRIGADRSAPPPAKAVEQMPEAAAAPQPPPPPPPKPKEPCETTLARLVGRLGTPDDALSDVDRDALYQDARELGRDEDGGIDETCRAKAFTALAARKTCGRAEAAVAGGLAVARVVAPADLKTLVERASPACAATFVEAAGYAANVDVDLARALLARARKDPDEAVRRSAWLAYGSTAEIASRTGREDVRKEVETAVAAELASSKGKARLLAVQTAGNAGCRPCLATLLALGESTDTDMRRNAISALRFQEDVRATRRACAAVEGDKESSVRDLGAWSLGLRATHPVARVPCLYRAALTDPDERVRISATQALGGLSDELQPAYAAVIQLTSPEAPASVRDLAKKILVTDPSHGQRVVDEGAIAAFLEEAARDESDAGAAVQRDR